MEKIILIIFLLDALFACIFFKHLRGKAFLLPLVTAGLTAAYQLFQSEKQKKTAKRLKPSNYVPGAVEESISNARTGAIANDPSYARGLERLKQSSASTINSAQRIAGNANQMQQVVADTDAREKDHAKDLEVSNSSFKNQSRQQLSSLLGSKGSYQRQSMDDFNAAKSALIGSSQQNQYNALTGLMEGAVMSMPDSAFGGTSGTRSAQDQTGGFGNQSYFKGRRGLGRMQPRPFDASKMYGSQFKY